jgi:uncharacterized membrane protein
LAYAASFLILGVYWLGHHAHLHFIRRSDRLFLWINLFFLMVISAMPFSTALVGAYYNEPIAVVVYCGNLIVAGLVLFAQLEYAAGAGRLFDADIDPRFLRLARQRSLMGPAIYLLAAGLAFINTSLSLVLCALTLVLYILPGRVDAYWKHPAAPDPQE